MGNDETIPVFEIGQKVRFHPIIGGKHDGRVWTITGHCLAGGEVCYWLRGKSGYVSERALSTYVPVGGVQS